MERFFINIPIGETIEAVIDYLTLNFAFVTRAISNVMETGIDVLVDAMLFLPPWGMILIFAAIAWWLGTRRIAIGTLLGLLLVWNMELWHPTVSTIAMVIISTVIAVIIGLPIGICAALFSPINRVVMPILDFMQTMPAFVYLIPAIPFFGLGPVSAIFSTVIFSMPPAIRLTALGIQQVPK